MVVYVTFLRDVACQKKLKLANVSRSYSQNNTGTVFLRHGVYLLSLGDYCLSIQLSWSHISVEKKHILCLLLQVLSCLYSGSDNHTTAPSSSRRRLCCHSPSCHRVCHKDPSSTIAATAG